MRRWNYFLPALMLALALSACAPVPYPSLSCRKCPSYYSVHFQGDFAV